MLKDHIIAFSENKLTLKHESFHDASIARKVTMFLKFYPGIKKAVLDKEAATLDIEYDSKRLPEDKVMQLLEQGLTWLVSEK